MECTQIWGSCDDNVNPENIVNINNCSTGWLNGGGGGAVHFFGSNRSSWPAVWSVCFGVVQVCRRVIWYDALCTLVTGLEMLTSLDITSFGMTIFPPIKSSDPRQPLSLVGKGTFEEVFLLLLKNGFWKVCQEWSGLMSCVRIGVILLRFPGGAIFVHGHGMNTSLLTVGMLDLQLEGNALTASNSFSYGRNVIGGSGVAIAVVCFFVVFPSCNMYYTGGTNLTTCDPRFFCSFSSAGFQFEEHIEYGRGFFCFRTKRSCVPRQ